MQWHALILTIPLLALATTACGDDAGGGTTDDETTADETTATATATETSPTASATQTDTTDGTDAGTTDDTTPGTTTGTTDSTGGLDTSTGADTSGTTTGGPAMLSVGIADATAFMNCKPIVPPDPLNLSLTLDFDNTAGGAVTSADVTAARLLLADVEAATFDLSPGSFGPFDAGATESVAAQKTDGSLMPANGCRTLQCGSDYDLEIEFDVDGAVAVATGSVTIECAF